MLGALLRMQVEWQQASQNLIAAVYLIKDSFHTSTIRSEALKVSEQIVFFADPRTWRFVSCDGLPVSESLELVHGRGPFAKMKHRETPNNQVVSRLNSLPDLCYRIHRGCPPSLSGSIIRR